MGIASEFKSAMEIAKSFPTEKQIELQQLLLAIQDENMNLQQQVREKDDRLRELEAQIARLNAWDDEMGYYDLREMGQYGTAYVSLKEPFHALCPQCYGRGVKSILQSNGDPTITDHRWVCQEKACGAKVFANRNFFASMKEHG